MNIRALISAFCLTLMIAGCSSDEPCNLSTPQPTYNTTLVEGESLMLQTQKVSNATYHWTGPNGFTSEEQNPIIPNANSTMDGVYSVTLSVGDCQGAAGSVSVIVAEPPCNLAKPEPSYNTGVMIHQDLMLHTETVLNATYYWYGPNGFTSQEQNPVVPNASMGHNGVYSVIIRVGNCFSEAGTVTVWVDFDDIPCAIANNTIYQDGIGDYAVLGSGWDDSNRRMGFTYQNNGYLEHYLIYFHEGVGRPAAGIYPVGGTLDEVWIETNYGSSMVNLYGGDLYLNYTPEGKIRVRFCNLPRWSHVPGYPGGNSLPALSGNITEN